MFTTLKISDVIRRLEGLLCNYGDLPVYILVRKGKRRKRLVAPLHITGYCNYTGEIKHVELFSADDLESMTPSAPAPVASPAKD